jgi:hypothetical protein
LFSRSPTQFARPTRLNLADFLDADIDAAQTVFRPEVVNDEFAQSGAAGFRDVDITSTSREKSNGACWYNIAHP